MTKPMTWAALKPLYASMFFDLGPQEIERRTGLGMRTLYCLLDGTTKCPRLRTLRDLQRVLTEWQPGICEMEHAER